MNTTIKSLIALAAATVLVAGCEKDKLQDNTVDAKPVLSFDGAVTGLVNLYNVENPSVTFKVLKDGDGACSATVSVMTQAQLNEYDPDYMALSEGCYTLASGDIEFQSDEASTEITVSFTDENLAKMKEQAMSAGDKALAIGLRIQSEDADVDADKSEVYRTFSLTGDRTVVGFSSELSGTVEMHENKDASFTFSLYRIGDAACSVRLVSMTQEQLAACDPSYIPVVADSYTVSSEEISFTAGETSKEVTVSITADGVAKIAQQLDDNNGKNVVFGFTIESDDAEIDQEQSELVRTVDYFDIPFALTSISGIDNGINNLFGIDALDKGDLLELPALTFSVSDKYSGTTSFIAKYRPDLVEQYNQTNNTSYQTLPEDVIGFETDPEEVTSGTEQVTVSLKKTGEIPDIAGYYLFPVEITNSGDLEIDFETIGNSSIQDNIYYLVLGSEVKLTADNLYSPCTATQAAYGGGAGGELPALVNNKSGDDFWSSDWGNVYQSKDWHHFIQVKFPQPLTEGIRVQYWNRPYLNPCPTEIEIWVTDKTTVEERDTRDGWILLGRYTMNNDGLPVSAEAKDPWSTPSYLFSETEGLEDKSITYMRFCMVKSQDSGGHGEQELGYGDYRANSASISELKVWGN